MKPKGVDPPHGKGYLYVVHFANKCSTYDRKVKNTTVEGWGSYLGMPRLAHAWYSQPYSPKKEARPPLACCCSRLAASLLQIIANYNNENTCGYHQIWCSNLLPGGDRLQERKVAEEPPLDKANVAHTAAARLFLLQWGQLFVELSAQVAPLMFHLRNWNKHVI